MKIPDALASKISIQEDPNGPWSLKITVRKILSSLEEIRADNYEEDLKCSLNMSVELTLKVFVMELVLHICIANMG